MLTLFSLDLSSGNKKQYDTSIATHQFPLLSHFLFLSPSRGHIPHAATLLPSLGSLPWQAKEPTDLLMCWADAGARGCVAVAERVGSSSEGRVGRQPRRDKGRRY
jgi:hypothetical protein